MEVGEAANKTPKLRFTISVLYYEPAKNTDKRHLSTTLKLLDLWQVKFEGLKPALLLVYKLTYCWTVYALKRLNKQKKRKGRSHFLLSQVGYVEAYFVKYTILHDF